MMNNNFLCVICKVRLSHLVEKGKKYQCPTCRREYILDYEIMEHENDFGSVHEEDIINLELEGINRVNNPIILEYENPSWLYSYDLDNEYHNRYNNKKDKIKIPDYMKDSAGRTIQNFKEEY